MSERSVIRQHPERSAPAEAARFLALGMVAHVSYAIAGQPHVIPMSYHYEEQSPRSLYLHGAHGSRTLEQLLNGSPVCVGVTLLDGLVYSRTALFHSMNYRSVVCYGRASLIIDVARKRALLERMIQRYFLGRQAGVHYQHSPEAHLEATCFLEVAIEEMSAKQRLGGPKGPDDANPQALGTAGVNVVEYPVAYRTIDRFFD